VLRRLRKRVSLRGVGRDEARLGLAMLCFLAVVAGVSGATVSAVFRQAGTLKWALAFTGPVGLLTVLAAKHPLRVAVGLLIVAVPFGNLRATIHGVEIPLVGGLAALAVVIAILSGPLPRRLSPLGAGAITGMVLLAIPLLSGGGQTPLLSGGGTPIQSHLVVLLAAGVVAWLTSAVAREADGLRFVLGALVVSATVQAAVAIWELHTKHQVNFYGSAGSSEFGSDYFFGYGQTFRPLGSFYDPISLGNLLALAIPISFVSVLTEPSAVKRLAGVAATLVIAIGLLLTLSRMSWVGATAGLLLSTLLLPRRERRRALLVLVPTAVALLLVIVSVGGQAFGNRFESILHPRQATVSTSLGDKVRVEDWTASLQIWESDPVAGVGLGNMPAALAQRLPFITLGAQAQSVYLQLLAEAGVLGGAALLLLLLTQARVIIAGLHSSQRRIAAGLAGSTLAMMLGWTTDVTIRYAPVACYVAVVFGAAAGMWQADRGSPPDWTDLANLVPDSRLGSLAATERTATDPIVRRRSLA